MFFILKFGINKWYVKNGGVHLKKKKYTPPTYEVDLFLIDSVDVILTSGIEGGGEEIEDF